MVYDFVSELRRVGALKEGHFLLSSGKHSDQYVEKFDLLRDPPATQRACAALIKTIGGVEDIELVVGPTTGGILLAFEIARQLGVKAAYAERVKDGTTEREFKRGTTIEPGSRVLAVDDIMTTGGSISETLAALESLRVDIRAIAVLVDRSGQDSPFDYPLHSLASLKIDAWEAADVPAWLAEIPISKPGSTSIASQ